jgi:hypothetical protein
MCRLMIAEGAQPGKAWIYGRLVAQTRNNPRCSVAWGWHVAPTLPVGDPAVTFVIDPALFERPQPLDAWKQAVNGATATLAETDAPVYRTSAGVSTTDPNYILTENVLATDRPAAQAEISRGRRSAAFGQCPARLGMAHAVALGGSDHRLFVLTDGQRLGMSDGARWIDLRRPPGRQKYELRRHLRYAEQALRLCFDVGPGQDDHPVLWRGPGRPVLAGSVRQDRRRAHLDQQLGRQQQEPALDGFRKAGGRLTAFRRWSASVTRSG